MIGKWRTFLEQRAVEWELPAPPAWRFVCHNNYHPHVTNLNILWFYGKETSPRVVTKFSRNPDLPAREFENLRRAYSAAPALIPSPLHFGPDGPFWGLWMGGVAGDRFRLERDCSPVSLASIIATVGELHSTLRGSEAPAPDRYARMVTTPLNALEQFGSSPAVKEGCRKLQAAVSAGWLATLPVIPQHGDLYFGNVLSNRGGWNIVDWESFGIVDLPLHDAATLLLSVLLETGKSPREWDHKLTGSIPGMLRSYMAAVNLPGADIAVLLELSFVNWFYLQWADGRAEFSERIYRAITDYFEHEESWKSVFVSV